MRTSLRCGDCGGRRIWHVEEVKDLAQGAGPLLLWAGEVLVGTLEQYCCGSCGHVEWYGKVSGTLPPPRPGLTCLECKGSRVASLPVYDAVVDEAPMRMAVQIRGDRALGALSIGLCHDCRHVRWVAADLEEIGADAVGRVEGPCRVCARAERRAIPSRDARRLLAAEEREDDPVEGPRKVVSEPRPLAIRTGFWSDRKWGALDVIVCVACGHVDWRARGLEHLRSDPVAGIRLVGTGSR